MIKKIYLRLFMLTSIIIFTICLVNPIYAQDEKQNDNVKRKKGLTAAIQNNQMDIMFPFWTAEKFVIAPAFSVLYVQDRGTDLAIGFVFKVYKSVKKISPYWGGRAGILILSPDDGNNTQDFLAGILIGGEYFLHPQFSFGIEAQINASFSDESSLRFNNPGGMILNTATAITANIYFE
jgi:hypothetical protein